MDNNEQRDIEEKKYNRELMNNALEAEEYFSLDELEHHALTLGQKEIRIIVKTEEQAKELNQIIRELSEDDLNELRNQGD